MDIFCKIINGEIPGKKVFEDDTVMVIMDVNPVSNGHCLIIPKVHYQDLYDMDIKTLNHILKIARDVSKILMEKLSCDGITLVQNNGSVQEVKHFHLHLIPKYEGKDKVDLSVDDVFHKIVEK
ncbi:MAG: HIT domain-containing protein [Bacilli bacterium]|nr:HIT domain-containing protein [Bacilli bacterium]